MDICTGCYADGLAFDFICGDEVYGSCTQLREFLEAQGPGLCAARRVQLHDYRCPRHQGHVRGSREIPP